MSSKTPAASPNVNCRLNIMNRFSVLQKCQHRPMVADEFLQDAAYSSNMLSGARPGFMHRPQTCNTRNIPNGEGELMGPLLGKDGRSSEFEE